MKLLVVVDMQKDFVDGSLGTEEAVAIVDNVVKKINEWEGQIICTLDTHSTDYLHTQEGQFLPVEHCIRDTAGWQFDEKIASALEGKEAIVIEKPTFGSEKLVECVKEMKPEEIELVGLCTDICVVSNALLLKAALYETPIKVDSSCCAGVTPDKHEAALEVMRSCQITVY